jgi:acylphosphatase
MKTVSILVSGKVQGVWFRKHTQEKAIELGITGTVENRSDGSVLIYATGTGEQIDQLTNWCRQGPPRAEVLVIDITPLPLTSYTGFKILRHFL